MSSTYNMKVTSKRNQTQLQLQFGIVRDNLHRAIDGYAEAAAQLAAHSPEMADKVLKDIKTDSKSMRKEVNRLARTIAGQSGRDHRDVWVMAYHALFKKSGTHVVAEAAIRGDVDHLDIVEEKGLFGTLASVLAEMLTAPGFAPKVDPCTA